MVAALEQRGTVDLLWGHRVECVDAAAEQATSWLRPVSGGRALALRARYVVGCDGARSPVRSGLQVAFGGSTFAQHWLVLDALVDRPLAKVPHPHFVGDTKRPVVTLPMSPGRHRWEFMIHPGEDPAPLLDPVRLRELIAPWLSGERVDIERAVVYTFHARTAARWRVGRVLLAGDAAHVMPPFVGQGFSSGARDAGNLAWKLDAVLHGAPEGLLDSYEAERRPHVRSMQRFALRWGGVVQTTNPRLAWIRDATIELLDRSGAISRSGGRVKPLPVLVAGAFVATPGGHTSRRGAGSLFPQTDRLDDRLGCRWAAVCASRTAADAWRAAGLYVVEHDDPWLSAHKADWALLRPDRYVFACGRAADLPQALHALRWRIGAGLRREPPRAGAVSGMTPRRRASEPTLRAA